MVTASITYGCSLHHIWLQARCLPGVYLILDCLARATPERVLPAAGDEKRGSEALAVAESELMQAARL